MSYSKLDETGAPSVPELNKMPGSKDFQSDSDRPYNDLSTVGYHRNGHTSQNDEVLLLPSVLQQYRSKKIVSNRYCPYILMALLVTCLLVSIVAIYLVCRFSSELSSLKKTVGVGTSDQPSSWIEQQQIQSNLNLTVYDLQEEIKSKDKQLVQLNITVQRLEERLTRELGSWSTTANNLNSSLEATKSETDQKVQTLNDTVVSYKDEIHDLIIQLVNTSNILTGRLSAIEDNFRTLNHTQLLFMLKTTVQNHSTQVAMQLQSAAIMQLDSEIGQLSNNSYSKVELDNRTSSIHQTLHSTVDDIEGMFETVGLAQTVLSSQLMNFTTTYESEIARLNSSVSLYGTQTQQALSRLRARLSNMELSTLLSGGNLPQYHVRSLSGVTLEDRAAQIRSPNYPSDYTNYMSYSWSLGWVMPGDYHTLNVTILDFRLEGGDSFATESDCSFDYLRVLTHKYCGTLRLSRTLTFNISTVNRVSMGFRTDGSGVYKGFKFNYYIL